jgi:hypothetical protein
MVRQLAVTLVAAAVLLGPSALHAQQGAPVQSARNGVIQAGFSGKGCASCQKGCGSCQKGGCSQKGCGCGQRGCNDCCPGCCVDWCPYGRWCGHGKDIGWTFRCGDGILPKCDNVPKWHAYYYGHGHYGHGHHHGHGHCNACGCWAGRGYLGPSNMYEGQYADLFYNYYAPQGSSQGVPTDMYVCPHDTPWPAIQTYYTYQPWLPHEFLYNHHRTYQRYYSGGMGRNTTHVSWGGSPIRRVHEQGLVW